MFGVCMGSYTAICLVNKIVLHNKDTLSLAFYFLFYFAETNH